MRKYEFGFEQHYHIGDVVVWRGSHPCIGRIKERVNMENYMICDSHDCLHYSHLRYATPKEMKQLGDKEIILI